MSGPDFADRQDFEDADRGFVGKLDPCVVTTDDGRVVWDNDSYSFLDAECPDTANPSLWRQAQLCAKQGLYEVTDGIYQVRGLDLSNMTLVEGEEGVIVIDPLISAETAAAALSLYREHRGDRLAGGTSTRAGDRPAGEHRARMASARRDPDGSGDPGDVDGHSSHQHARDDVGGVLRT